MIEKQRFIQNVLFHMYLSFVSYNKTFYFHFTSKHIYLFQYRPCTSYINLMYCMSFNICQNFPFPLFCKSFFKCYFPKRTYIFFYIIILNNKQIKILNLFLSNLVLNNIYETYSIKIP